MDSDSSDSLNDTKETIFSFGDSDESHYEDLDDTRETVFSFDDSDPLGENESEHGDTFIGTQAIIFGSADEQAGNEPEYSEDTHMPVHEECNLSSDDGGAVPSGDTENIPVAGGNRGIAGSKRRKISGQCNLDPFEVLKTECCSNLCLKQLCSNDVSDCLMLMRDRNESEQKQYILDTLSRHSTVNRIGKRAVLESKFIISGKEICGKGWCIVHNVSNWRYEQCCRDMKNGMKKVLHGNSVAHMRIQGKTSIALAWMRRTFKRIGDFLPNRDIIQLPYTWTKIRTYRRMKEEFVSRGMLKKEIISYVHFTRIWSQKLSRYVIAKATEFTQCSTCIQLEEDFLNATEATMDKIAELKELHDRQVENERDAYHDAREDARRNPRERTCAIIDGMDQSKTNLPHFIVKDKDNANLAQLPIHLTGVLIHTGTADGKVPFVYHDVKHIPHDSNLTIHCLMESLTRVKDHLGRVLFLQLDNCFRENKNKYVFSFMALLVELQIFEEVTVHFLPVGHTHEDIDQMFSCISRHLKSSNAYTLADLESGIQECYTPAVTVIPVKMVPDYKTTLQEVMAGAYGGHSKPLWFRFRNIDDKCHMHYRMWKTSEWRPFNDGDWPNGLLCLKELPDLTGTLPWVLPSLEKLELEKLCKELPDSYNNRMAPIVKDWWRTFIRETLQTDYDEIPPARPWSLRELKKQPEDVASLADSECLLELQNRVNKECTDVFIGKQGKISLRKVKAVSDFTSVKTGMLVAVHCEEKEGRPFIGTVIERRGDEVTVGWMKGSWKGMWHQWLIKSGRTRVQYTSTIPVNSMILWDFALTSKSRLRSATASELKEKYDELDA